MQAVSQANLTMARWGPHAGYDAGEHIGEPSLWIDVVEFRCHDQRGHDSGAVGAPLGTGEEPRLAAERNLAVILPISGKKL